MPKQLTDKLQRSHKSISNPTSESEEKLIADRASFESNVNPHMLSHGNILQLQRTIGNQAVMRMLSGGAGVVQRKFVPPLSTNVDEVFQQLLVANPTLKRWKVEQAMKATQPFASLQEVAAFLKINAPGGETTGSQPPTTTTEQPITGTTPTPEVPTKPKWMTNLRPTGPRPEPVKVGGTTTQPEWLTGGQLRSVTPPQQTTTEQTPSSSTPIEHKFGKGQVSVSDDLKSMVNSENIANNKPILKNAPEFINMTFGGVAYRVKPSQDFLNVDKSAIYRDNSSEIRGAEVELMRPPINDGVSEDILVITDGHHRFVWCAYHGLPFQATFKKTRLATSMWRDVRYKPTPSNLKK